MKLSAPQQELLDAMKRGVRVMGMFGIDNYYFRTDTMERCTRYADALLRRKLVEQSNKDWRGCVLRIAIPQSGRPEHDTQQPKSAIEGAQT